MKHSASFAFTLAALLFLSSFGYAWWNADWQNRYAITNLVTTKNLDVNNIIVLQDIDFSALTTSCWDLNDLRVVEEGTSQELSRQIQGMAATTDGNLLFKLKNTLAADTHEGVFYIYTNNTTGCLGIGTKEYLFEDFNNVSDIAEITIAGGSYAIGTSPDLNATTLTMVSDAASDNAVLRVEKRTTFTDVNVGVWFKTSNSSSAYGMQILVGASGGGTTARVISAATGTLDIIGQVADQAVAQIASNQWYYVILKKIDSSHASAYLFDSNCTPAGEVINHQLPTDSWVATPIIGFALQDKGALTTEYSNVELGPTWCNIKHVPTSYTVSGTEVVPTDQIDLNVWRVDGYDNTEDTFPTFIYENDGNLTIDFNLFNADNNRMLVDINYSTTELEGTGTRIVEDLNLSNLELCSDLNFQDGASCSWDWNISGIATGTYYILIDANTTTQTVFKAFKVIPIAVPRIRATFYDENTSKPLIGLNVEYDGTMLTTDGSGRVDVNLAISGPETRTIHAWQDNNYGNRYFEFDVNTYTNLDVNLFMLRDVNGIDLDFKFYESDAETILSNKRVRVYWYDVNYAGIRTTDSSGRVSFFLNPDSNYYFVTDNGVRYDKVQVTLQVPKDEDSLSGITPYSLLISRLANKLYVGQTTQIVTEMFSNTSESYLLDFNAGLNYYTRLYELSIPGNPKTYSFQPFLVKVADSGDFIFNVKDSRTLQPLSGIKIVVERTIPDEGTVEVYSLTTDSTGKAKISLLIGKEYDAYFYYEDSLVHTALIRPTTASLFYQVSLDLLSVIIPEDVNVSTLIVSVVPTTPYIVTDTTGNVDVNATITMRYKTISRMTIWAKDTNGTVIQSFNYDSWVDENVAVLKIDINAAGEFDSRYALYIQVDVNTTDGNHFSKTSIHWRVVQTERYELFYLLTSFANSLNPSGSKIATSFIAILLTILAVASIAFTGVHDPAMLSILSLAILSLFVFIGWVDLLPFVFVVVVAVLVMFLTERVMG